MIGVLLLGFWKLQVIDADRYSSLAERNRVREIPVIAPRGRMLTADGRVLVDNRPAFSILLCGKIRFLRKISPRDCRWSQHFD